MSTRVHSSTGVLREFWDDTARTYTTYNEQGTQTSSRAYTPEENARVDAEALRATQQANDANIGNKIETVDMPAMQAILDQTNAELRADPAQELKSLATAVRRLDRKVQRLLDGTE